MALIIDHDNNDITASAGSVTIDGSDPLAAGAPSGFAIDTVSVEPTVNSATDSIAIGENAYTAAVKNYSVAIGSFAFCNGIHSVALGGGYDATVPARTDANYTTSVGYDTHSQGVSSTSIGTGANAQSALSLAAGANAVASGHSATAIGPGTDATIDDAVAIGAYAQATTGTSAIAIGGGDSISTSANATGTYATAIGYDSLADAADCIAIGKAADAGGGNATVVGNTSTAGLGASTFGSNSDATGSYSAALGYFAKADRQQEVSISPNLGTNGRTGHFSYTTTTTGAAGTATLDTAIPANTSSVFDALIIGRRTDADGKSSAYRLKYCADNNAAGTGLAVVGSQTKETIAEDDATTDVNFSISAQNVRLTVTGPSASETWRWVVKLDYTEAKG